MNIEEMLNSGEIKIVQLAVNILKNEGIWGDQTPTGYNLDYWCITLDGENDNLMAIYMY